MRTAIVSLPGYEKAIVKLLTVEERKGLENHLVENPEINPVISGTGGVRKARWSRGSLGKSGGHSRHLLFHESSWRDLNDARIRKIGPNDIERL